MEILFSVILGTISASLSIFFNSNTSRSSFDILAMSILHSPELRNLLYAVLPFWTSLYLCKQLDDAKDISDKIDIFESIIKKEKECKKHYDSLKMKVINAN